MLPGGPIPLGRKGLYYRSNATNRRLYFSENEIASIQPQYDGYRLQTIRGGVYMLRSAVPDYTEFETPYRESVPKDHYYRRS